MGMNSNVGLRIALRKSVANRVNDSRAEVRAKDAR
jgi:hypothetical protein